jgi:hypothetical protein
MRPAQSALQVKRFGAPAFWCVAGLIMNPYYFYAGDLAHKQV